MERSYLAEAIALVEKTNDYLKEGTFTVEEARRLHPIYDRLLELIGDAMARLESAGDHAPR